MKSTTAPIRVWNKAFDSCNFFECFEERRLAKAMEYEICVLPQRRPVSRCFLNAYEDVVSNTAISPSWDLATRRKSGQGILSEKNHLLQGEKRAQRPGNYRQRLTVAEPCHRTARHGWGCEILDFSETGQAGGFSAGGGAVILTC